MFVYVRHNHNVMLTIPFPAGPSVYKSLRDLLDSFIFHDFSVSTGTNVILSKFSDVKFMTREKGENILFQENLKI